MYRIGTNVTDQFFVYPTREILEAFFEAYTPEYPLYFHGSVRDRMFGYNPTFESKRSFDVDLIIFAPEGPLDFPKIHEMLDAAVRVGFRHRLLVDIICMHWPEYFDAIEDPEAWTNEHAVDEGDTRDVLKLSPTVNAIPGSKWTGDTTAHDAPYIVYESLMMMNRKRCVTSKKLHDKIRLGFLIHRPTPIDHFFTASIAASATTPTMKNITT